MRLSVDEDDHGYWSGACMNVVVWIDGVKVKHCITADTDVGEVVRLQADAKGKLMFDAIRNGAMLERLHGNVEIDVAEDVLPALRNHLASKNGARL